MKWLWLGWLLCALTVGLFGWIFIVEIPPVSAMIGGMKLPDQVPFGYDEEGARALFAAFKADHAAAQANGRTSASQAYLILHAGNDLILLVLLAASLGFCAFAALAKPAQHSQIPRLAVVGFGLVLALAFAYLASDFMENSVADEMFGPEALTLPFRQHLVFVLQVLTRSKFASLAVAVILIAALWLWRLKPRRRDTRPKIEA